MQLLFTIKIAEVISIMGEGEHNLTQHLIMGEGEHNLTQHLIPQYLKTGAIRLQERDL
jgi:hypothetical protein